MPAHRRAPFPNIAHAVLAKVQDHVALLLFQQIAHELMARAGFARVRCWQDAARDFAVCYAA